jgi:hypothetical protein
MIESEKIIQNSKTFIQKQLFQEINKNLKIKNIEKNHHILRDK